MWLGVHRSEIERWQILDGDMTGRFAYFRCDFTIPEMLSSELSEGSIRAPISVTANSRYRLWINAEPVLSGPAKGDVQRHFYEDIDISSHLKVGKNILAVQVLYNDPESAKDQLQERSAIFGVLTPRGGHRLAVEGSVIRGTDNTVITPLTTGSATWQVWLDGSHYLKSTEITVNLGAVCEDIDLRKLPADWKSSDNLCDSWAKPEIVEPVVKNDFMQTVGLIERFQIRRREIPLMYERRGAFARELTGSELLSNGKLEIAAGQTREFLLDSEVIINAYPRFLFQGGAGAVCEFTYLEKFTNSSRKIRRDDWQQSDADGISDKLILNGSSICYEPFWYRTFRYLKISIKAADEPVIMLKPDYRQTGYPLQAESWVASSAPWVNEVWEICVRTLENCMMETYMDCPYYEQMQFPMDTRLQILFNYVVSQDIDLVRKALQDYHYAMLPIGLIPGKYPSSYCQIISTFSLHYIFMLAEYYRQTGDKKLIREYRTDVDIILAYYERRIGEDGLLGRLGYWEFVDWQEAWKETAGMPTALQFGPSTIINLMYGYALLSAAEIYEATDRPETAAEYRSRQKQIAEKIQKSCWDQEAGLYREGPELRQFSQHAQSWAVLNGLTDRSESKELMKRAMFGGEPAPGCEPIIPCSFSTAYEFYRAMEIAGIYEDTESNMMRWAALPAQGCTTCPEEPENGRSECHAWSALPLYEMIRVMAGIRNTTIGWQTITVKPHLEYLPDLRGEAVTPHGKIKFNYTRNQNDWQYVIELPENISGQFIYPDGRVCKLEPGCVNRM